MSDRSAENPLAIAAIRYAKRGLKVLPCKPGDKRPATAHGYKDATDARGELVRRWKHMPRANVGIATGQISQIVVLDVDPRNGGRESLRELERLHGSLPKTAVVDTGGDGEHYYFALPQGVLAKSFVLAPGLDVKADGGYVIAPPSVHPSGKPYKWRLPPSSTPLAPAPDWLLDGDRNQRATQANRSTKATPVVDAADSPLGRMFKETGLLGKLLDAGKRSVVCPWQAEHTVGKTLDSSTAYSDVIRSAFRRHSISVPTASDQGSGAFDRQFRSSDQRFRSSDHGRPSG